MLQVTAFIKTCKEQIDILQVGITEEEKKLKGWLGLSADSTNADTIAHKQGVVRQFYLLCIFWQCNLMAVHGILTKLIVQLL